MKRSKSNLPTNKMVNTILNKFGNSSDVILISNHVNSGGANGKNVGIVSSVLFVLKYKDFGLMLKSFFVYNVKKFVS